MPSLEITLSVHQEETWPLVRQGQRCFGQQPDRHGNVDIFYEHHNPQNPAVFFASML